MRAFSISQGKIIDVPDGTQLINNKPQVDPYTGTNTSTGTGTGTNTNVNTGAGTGTTVVNPIDTSTKVTDTSSDPVSTATSLKDLDTTYNTETNNISTYYDKYLTNPNADDATKKEALRQKNEKLKIASEKHDQWIAQYNEKNKKQADTPSTELKDEQGNVVDQLLSRDLTEITSDPASLGLNRLGSYKPGTSAFMTRKLSERLVNLIQLESAKYLKGQGQVSNSEREMLAAAATALDTGLNEADYRAMLLELKQKLSPKSFNAVFNPGGSTPAAQTTAANTAGTTVTPSPTVAPNPSVTPAPTAGLTSASSATLAGGLPQTPQDLGSLYKKGADALASIPQPIKNAFPITQLPERIPQMLNSYTLPETRDYLGKAVQGKLAIQKKPQSLGDMAAGLAGPIGTSIARPDIGKETIGPALEIAFVADSLSALKHKLYPTVEEKAALRQAEAVAQKSLNKKQLDQIIKAGDAKVANRPELAGWWKKEKASMLKDPSVSNFLDRFSRWGTAYKNNNAAQAAGTALEKDTASAQLQAELKRVATEVIGNKSPVFKQLTEEMAKIYQREAKAKALKYGAQNVGKMAGTAIGFGALGYGLNSLLNKVSGK